VKFGMIGAGTLSQAIASHSLETGHEVIFTNSQGPDTFTELVEQLGRGASAGTIEEAGEADFVVLAVTWSRVREALRALPPRPGRVLIDVTNEWADSPPAAVLDVLVVGGSEFVASLGAGRPGDQGVQRPLRPGRRGRPGHSGGPPDPLLRRRRRGREVRLPRGGQGVRLRAGGPRTADDGPAHAGRRPADRSAPVREHVPHPVGLS